MFLVCTVELGVNMSLYRNAELLKGWHKNDSQSSLLCVHITTQSFTATGT